MSNEDKPAFTVKVDSHEYHVWADGRIEGFTDSRLDQTVVIFNRIPQIIRDTANAAPERDIRAQCLLTAAGSEPRASAEDTIAKADAFAQYILSGTPRAER